MRGFQRLQGGFFGSARFREPKEALLEGLHDLKRRGPDPMKSMVADWILDLLATVTKICPLAEQRIVGPQNFKFNQQTP